MKLSGNSSGYFLPVCVFVCAYYVSVCTCVISVCVYMCMCYICVYTYVCCPCVYMCMCVYVLCLCVYVCYTCVYIHVCVVCIHVYLCLCVYVCYVCVYLVSVCMYVSILGAGRRAVITLSPIPGWGWNLLGAIRPLHGPHPPLPTPPPLIWAR